jgi:hypothetical protein
MLAEEGRTATTTPTRPFPYRGITTPGLFTHFTAITHYTIYIATSIEDRELILLRSRSFGSIAGEVKVNYRGRKVIEI